MAALDPNNDGVIDEKEIEQASKSLKTLDKNSDGKITMEELRPPRPEGRPDRGERPRRPEGAPDKQ
jgi:Ca2+-binding EF-hand superfamily protein